MKANVWRKYRPVQMNSNLCTNVIVAALKEQLLHSNTKLDELISIYETTKQSEIEEKNKTKHLERSVRALKIEKDQLFTVSSIFLDFSHLAPTKTGCTRVR